MTWLPPPPPPTAASRSGTRWRTVGVVALLLALAMAAALVVFAPRTMRIEGQSMSPALRHGDRTVFARPPGAIARADIVSYRYPRDPRKRFAGRIVGLPGERIAIVRGIVHVDGVPLDEPYLAGVRRSAENIGELRLGTNEYYVLGDNRTNSSDSREWGPVDAGLIQKRFVYVWWRETDDAAPSPGAGRR